MITVRRMEYFYWSNRFARHPVTLVELEAGEDLSWHMALLPATAREMLGQRFPLLAEQKATSRASECLAIMCLSMQLEKFAIPAAVGWHDGYFYFATADQHHAVACVNACVALINFLLQKPDDVKLAQALESMDDHCEDAALDQSVRAMVALAQKRGIPWFRLAAGLRDVQFGQGHLQRRMRETLSSEESTIATSYARDKTLTCSMLGSVGLPVGRFAMVSTPETAAQQAQAMGFPVVLKPVAGGKGADVVIGLQNAQAVHDVARQLLTRSSQLLLQSYIPGDDHRLLVVGGRFIAAARREPASVTGDGKHTVHQLIDIENRNPRRGKKFYRLMNRIVVDGETPRILASQGQALDSVPPAGMRVMLRRTANISTGGSAVDVTDIIHPDNISLAEQAAGIIGLKVAGIDFLTTDISRSWRETGGGICEINASVGLRPHWLANPARDVVGPILNTVFPQGRSGRIPTAMITGSNGKTTTRMLDHILRAAGHTVGCVNTDVITVNGDVLVEGDWAGPSGASLVLRDARVTAAVLETARGGILKRGIYLEHCNVAAMLNVDRDQVGIEGVSTVEEMAALKRKVVDTARQRVVLNAEDVHCLAVAKDFATPMLILFALDPQAEGLAGHRAAGGTIATLAELHGKETLVLEEGDKQIVLLPAEEIPATLTGRVRHNVANALAAAALAHGLGMPAEIITKGLRSFSLLEHSVGRFNLIDDLPARVLFDFANNAPALRTALKSIPALSQGTRICVFTSPGNRTDEDIDAIAQVVAGHFDHYVCFERSDWQRGRPDGAIARRLATALEKTGIDEDRILCSADPASAVATAAQLAGKGDFIVIFGTDVKYSVPQIRAALAKAAA